MTSTDCPSIIAGVVPVVAPEQGWRAALPIACAGLLGCDRGVAAVEFALAAPILLGALVPVADLGIAFAKQQQLRQAVQAGAQYAASHPWDQNAPTAIASAVTRGDAAGRRHRFAVPLPAMRVSERQRDHDGDVRQPLRKL